MRAPWPDLVELPLIPDHVIITPFLKGIPVNDRISLARLAVIPLSDLVNRGKETCMVTKKAGCRRGKNDVEVDCRAAAR